MKLAQIIQASADRMLSVSVAVDEAHEWVEISDDDGEQDDIFLQGDDAADFIGMRDQLYEQVQTLDKGVIELHLAEKYVENFWN